MARSGVFSILKDYLCLFRGISDTRDTSSMSTQSQHTGADIVAVRIVNKSGNPLPAYQTEGSAGMDLRASIAEPITIPPLGRAVVPTGVFLELPRGYEAQIRPRSGLAARSGVTVLNSPGTIDSDYRGEVCAILVNLSADDFVVRDGERICQMVVCRHATAELTPVEALGETGRGQGGFGSTGVG